MQNNKKLYKKILLQNVLANALLICYARGIFTDHT